MEEAVFGASDDEQARQSDSDSGSDLDDLIDALNAGRQVQSDLLHDHVCAHSSALQGRIESQQGERVGVDSCWQHALCVMARPGRLRYELQHSKCPLACLSSVKWLLTHACDYNRLVFLLRRPRPASLHR